MPAGRLRPGVPVAGGVVATGVVAAGVGGAVGEGSVGRVVAGAGVVVGAGAVDGVWVVAGAGVVAGGSVPGSTAAVVVGTGAVDVEPAALGWPDPPHAATVAATDRAARVATPRLAGEGSTPTNVRRGVAWPGWQALRSRLELSTFFPPLEVVRYS